jgi:hypothetical protein
MGFPDFSGDRRSIGKGALRVKKILAALFITVDIPRGKLS